MVGYVARRLAQSIIVAVAVAFIAFAVTDHVGDPLANLVAQDASQQERDQVAAMLGLDAPFPLRFAHYLEQIATGNFGLSYRTREPVLKMIVDRLPASIELSVCAILLALVIGVPMGVYCGLFPKAWLSQVFLGIAMMGISLPTFLIGIFLILIFSVWLGWLPAFGRGDVVAIGWWTTGLVTAGGLKALVLPTVTLGLFLITLVIRLIRGEMLEVMREEYIRFARARGIPSLSIYFRHALKNSIVPVVTVLGLQFGSVLVFAMITETVFSWPGIGSLMIQSVTTADIPVMTTYLVMTGVLFTLINLAVDLLYLAIDPRVRLAGA
ncbi:ABC transporter permease [Xanthobacter dioxanivorans]|uniref:ABC transporter permease n=1 Tax=Xanthobacter dioxanivorans TaxID=2528964 RepID=A0A974PT66_9HYPH|nr:ABC transporter permease [Xanthobacter dioxanivorans]QRG09255.1 ABC transporter permease [Xanthobacter dioxanivorans]